MKSTPYNPATLSPVETMLLKRLEAMEAGFVQLLQVIGQNLPATVQAIQAIGQGAGQTVSASEEAAAASYLTELGYSSTANGEEGSDLAPVIDEYLPSLFDQPHPFSLPIDTLLEGRLEADKLVAIADDEHMPANLQAVVAEPALYLTTAFQSQLAPTFIVPLDERSWFLLDPFSRQWQLLTWPVGAANGFVHRCLEFYNTSVIEKALKQFFLKPLSAKLRGYFKDDASLDTTIAVQIAQILDSDYAGKSTLVIGNKKVGYMVDNHQQLGRILAIVGEGQTAAPQIVFRKDEQQNVSHYYVLMGNQQFQPVPMATLSIQSKNLMRESLTTLVKLCKPSKRSSKSLH